MMISRSEHHVTTSSSDEVRLPRTWETVLEFVALVETLPDSEWAQRAPQLRQLAEEIIRETADFPRPVPAEVQRFLERCAT
jgi:hypothetical protein